MKLARSDTYNLVKGFNHWATERGIMDCYDDISLLLLNRGSRVQGEFYAGAGLPRGWKVQRGFVEEWIKSTLSRFQKYIGCILSKCAKLRAVEKGTPWRQQQDPTGSRARGECLPKARLPRSGIPSI